MFLTSVRHTVKDYAVWRKAFDEKVPLLERAGVLSTCITQIEGNPNDVLIVNTWPARENWDAFIASHNFKGPEDAASAQASAGVIGEPEFLSGEVV